MAQRVLTGGRCQFFLNGTRLGFGMGVTVTENIVQERIQPLDNLRTVEFATTNYTMNMRVQLYRIPNEDIVAAGLFPMQGRTPDEQKRNLLNFAPLTADIYDSYSSAYVGKATGLVPTTRTFNIQSRGVVMSDITFEGIAYGDEGSSNF